MSFDQSARSRDTAVGEEEEETVVSFASQATEDGLDVDKILRRKGADGCYRALASLTPGLHVPYISIGSVFALYSDEDKIRLLDTLRGLKCRYLYLENICSRDDNDEEAIQRAAALAINAIECDTVELEIKRNMDDDDISAELLLALSRQSLKKMAVVLMSATPTRDEEPKEFLPLTLIMSNFEEVVVQGNGRYIIHEDTFRSIMSALTRGSIKKLEIDAKFLSEHYAILAEAMSDPSLSIEELKLVLDSREGDDLDTAQAAFTDAVCRSSLRVLDFGIESLPLSLCVRFGTMIDQNQGLESLTLRYLEDDNELGALAFLLGLRNNTTLQTLNFGCELYDNSGALLADILRGPSGLRKLNLRWNYFGDPSAAAFAAALMANTTLRELDLARSFFKEAGFRAIIGALRFNSALTFLDLSCALFRDTFCWPDLAQALEQNSHLQRLDLSHIPIDEDSLVRLFAALRVNNSIKELSVGSEQLKHRFALNDDSYQQMVDMLEENTTLINFQIHCLCSKQKKILRMYETLNKTINREALKGPYVVREDWLRALFALKDGPLDCIFYILSKCPFVLQESDMYD